MTEFESDGYTYRIAKLTAMQQFHVSRRVSPLIPPLIPVFLSVVKSQQSSKDKLDYLQAMGGLLQPFADALSQMSDEQAEYVFNACLSVVKRQVNDSWMPVWIVTSKVPMFADLNDLAKMIPLVIRVLGDSLGPFIQGLLTSQGQTEATAAA